MFDTHAVIKRLQEAGFSEQQAEAVAGVLQDTQQMLFEHLATKRDIQDLQRSLKELEVSTKRDLKEFEVSTKRDIQDLQRGLKELEASTKRDLKALEASTKRDLKAFIMKVNPRVLDKPSLVHSSYKQNMRNYLKAGRFQDIQLDPITTTM
ncbi:MAG: hypothetical protein U1F76_24675 [Candidatus Competibacteraceae bacterium]